MISIRRRLTRDLLGVSLVLACAGLVAVYFAARLEIVEQFDLALQAKALAIRAHIHETGGELRVDFEDRLFPGFEEGDAEDFFQVWSTDGRTVARSRSMAGADFPMQVGTVERPKFWNLTLPNGRRGRALGFAFQPKLTGTRAADMAPVDAKLVVAGDSDELSDALLDLSIVVGVWGALLAAVTVLLVPRVLRRGLRPLESLGDQAARIDAESLAERFPTSNLPAELHPIAQRLNDLLARLERSFDRERRVNADLAHELRTPLAELRIVAESALKWPEARDASTDRDALAIAEQMESIVERMLALARSEQGRLQLHSEPVELSQLVAGAWRPFAARAAERELVVTFDLKHAAIVTDPVLLRSILSNLFDNAVDHTPARSAVHLACGPAPDGRARLSVANATDNLVAADVPRLFERFWRKETARTTSAHVGLGLALVQSLAVALGWEVAAALGDDAVLTITLREKTAQRPAS